MNTVQLLGRIALVTGASRGIGRAVALSLAEAGADIAANYHVAEREADALAGEIKRTGRRCLTVQADVSKAADVERLISTVRSQLGMIARNPAAIPDLIPIGRFGTVQEVADVIMLAVLNGYITGQTISVNGGAYMT